MDFHCVDLPQFGVVLVPPTDPEYDKLLTDIRKRVEHPVTGSPPALPKATEISEANRDGSAIVVNRGPRSIAKLQLLWAYEQADGRRGRSAIGGGGGSTSLLEPFGLDQSSLNLYGYWHVILPGSKRYLDIQGDQIGDNTDVRPPTGDELWSGGGMGGGFGSRFVSGAMKHVTLTIDGVFFTDGAFAGPNNYQMWEQVVASAEAHLEIGRIAKQGHFEGRPVADILSEIQKLTGPGDEPPPHPRAPRDMEEYRQWALKLVAWPISSARKLNGDERTVYMLSDWADAPVPKFRKL